jgi:uncharacterized protein YllA (UPF0747 family)
VLRGETFAPPLPDALATSFGAARKDVEAALGRLGASTASLGPVSNRNLEKTRARILESLDIYARKVSESAGGRGGDAAARAERIRTSLLPGGRLQEQSLAGLWYLNRYGMDFFARLGEGIDFRAKGHQVVVLDA